LGKKVISLFGCPELAGLDWLGELLVKPGNELRTASIQPSQRLQPSRTSYMLLHFFNDVAHFHFSGHRIDRI